MVLGGNNPRIDHGLTKHHGLTSVPRTANSVRQVYIRSVYEVLQLSVVGGRSVYGGWYSVGVPTVYGGMSSREGAARPIPSAWLLHWGGYGQQ